MLVNESRAEELANELGEQVARETHSEKEFYEALELVIENLQAAVDAAKDNVGEGLS